MKVLPSQNVDFAAGDILSPDDLNDLWLYSKDCVDDVKQKRFAITPLPLQFVEAVDTPYTEAMNIEERTFRFKSPFPVIVTRGFLHANLVSTAAVKVDIVPAAGGTVPGCTSPFLTTGGAVASASVDTFDENVDKFVLAKDTEYLIKVTTTGTFTLNRFDVILLLATDRWASSGTPSPPDFAPTLVRDVDNRDATVVNANNTALTTEANKFAANKSAPMPMMFVKHGMLSGTSANLRTFRVPLVDVVRCRMRAVRIYVFAYMAGVGGGTVTADLQNSAGVSQASAVANVAGVTQATGDSGALTNKLIEGVVGCSADNAQDWKLVLSNSAGAVNAIKVVALVWVARA